MAKLFGTDGIRGKYGEKITEALMKKVAYALPIFSNPVVLVACDTRESSNSLKIELIKALKEVGFHVHDFNILSTPALIYLSYKYRCLALMITASHNPYMDNGIKIIKEGHKLNESEIETLETQIGKKLLVNGCDIPFVSLYEYQKVVSSFKIKDDLKVAFDLSNGALTYLAKDILSSYNFNYTLINDKPNGTNINDKCGSTNISLFKKNIGSMDIDYLFSFDGDGDRVIAMDKDGNIYDGNHFIYIFANYLNRISILKNENIVLTIDSNPGVINSFIQKGYNVYQSEVGDASVKELMVEKNATVGGEESGHVIVSKFSPTGDGLLNALLMLEILSLTGESMKNLTEGLKVFPVLKENLSKFNPRALGSARLNKIIQSHKDSILSQSLILVRKSGTENLLRISVSTGDSILDKEIMSEILKVCEETE